MLHQSTMNIYDFEDGIVPSIHDAWVSNLVMLNL